jgi:hypothetical protein
MATAKRAVSAGVYLSCQACIPACAGMTDERVWRATSRKALPFGWIRYQPFLADVGYEGFRENDGAVMLLVDLE